MLGEVVRDRYLRRSAWRGYARDEVDQLFARVAVDLEAGRSPSSAIEGATLHRGWGGYAVADVDWLVGRLRAERAAADGRPPRRRTTTASGSERS